MKFVIYTALVASNWYLVLELRGPLNIFFNKTVAVDRLARTKHNFYRQFSEICHNE